MPLLFYSYVLGYFCCVQFFVTPWTVAVQTSLSMGYPRKEYWIGLPFPSLGDLPGPRIKHASLVPQRTTAVLSWPNLSSAGFQAPLYTHHYCCSVAKSCLTLCNPMDCSMPGFPVLHYLLEFAQTHVH